MSMASKWSKSGKVALGVTVALGLSALGLRGLENRYPQLNTALSVWNERRLAQPAESDRLPLPVRIAAAEDAAPLYRAALANLPPAFEELVNVLPLLEEASSRPHCSDLGPNRWQLRQVACELLAMAQDDAVAHPDIAEWRIALASRIANHIGEAPMGYLETWLIRYKAMAVVERIARHYPDRLNYLFAMTNDWKPSPEVTEEAYRYFATQIDKLAWDDHRFFTKSLWDQLYSMGIEAIERRYLRTITPLWEQVRDQDFATQWRLLGPADLAFAAATKSSECQYYPSPLRLSFTSSLGLQLQTRWRQHRTFLMLLATKQQRGHWPTEDEFFGISDPFRPTRTFASDGKRFWSVGDNGKDDHGTGDDLVVEYDRDLLVADQIIAVVP